MIGGVLDVLSYCDSTQTGSYKWAPDRTYCQLYSLIALLRRAKQLNDDDWGVVDEVSYRDSTQTGAHKWAPDRTYCSPRDVPWLFSDGKIKLRTDVV